MLPNSNLISCNFIHSTPLFHFKITHKTTIKSPSLPTKPILILLNNNQRPLLSPFGNMGSFHICLKSSFSYDPLVQNDENGVNFDGGGSGGGGIASFSDDPLVQNGENDVNFDGGGSGGGGGGGGGGGDWITSFLLFVFWASLLYYVFTLSPNQTPLRDMYFLKKLCNLVGDDGFRMNQVLVSLWYIMGLWPIVYCMLLLPSGRSSKGNIPIWPFLTLSFFGGAYALIPYFILWRPPPPPVEEEELSRWPLNFLESKITAGFLGVAGLGLIVYATMATGDWNEFYQYFRESKLVHATSLDFSLLSAFAPFWVYNDMTVRRCYDKTAWLLPLSVVPFLGPALYLLLRPPLRTMPVSLESTLKSD